MVSSTTTISASFISKRSRSPDLLPRKKITIKIKDQQGDEDKYKIGLNAHLKKLMDAYCVKKAVDKRAVRFIYNDRQIKPRQTPAQLMMEDEDIIDMVMEQGGGGPLTGAEE